MAAVTSLDVVDFSEIVGVTLQNLRLACAAVNKPKRRVWVTLHELNCGCDVGKASVHSASRRLTVDRRLAFP
jgi:hypothetical protein